MSFRQNYVPRGGIRIDARTGESKRLGIRGAHKDGRGNIIGGYDEDGQAFGTKDRSGSGVQNPAAPRLPAQVPTGGTAPATGNVLNSRQNLFKEMEAAGSAGLTPAMRAKARNLGVTDESFNTAAGRVKSNEGVTPQIASATPGTAPATSTAGPRINRLTGKPFGWLPGDDAKTATATRPAVANTPGTAKQTAFRQAASPIPTTPSPVSTSTPSWMQATAPVQRTSGTAVPAPKTGGLESTLADIRSARASTQAMIAKPVPGQAPPAKSFTMPPVANAQSIGATPASTTPAPASQFAQLTTPKPAVVPVQAAKPTTVFREPATPPKQSGPSFTTPQAVQARNQAAVTAKQATKRQAYNAAWNATPNLPLADPNSMANKSYKSVRTFLSGNSY